MRAPYTLCTGSHFKPAQSLYTELLLHSVIDKLVLIHGLKQAYRTVYKAIIKQSYNFFFHSDTEPILTISSL